jgi:hypothetical protein
MMRDEAQVRGWAAAAAAEIRETEPASADRDERPYIGRRVLEANRGS